MLGSMQEVLEYAFRVLNEVYYNNELPEPIITIMSSPRTNGHFTVGKVWKENDTKLHEINISAEHLDRTIENICATLNHEMVHYYCSLNGIQDTSQGGRYHNKRFQVEATRRGLHIEQGKYIGWSITNPTLEFINILRKYNISKPIEINRDGALNLPIGTGGNNGLGGDDTSSGKKKTSTRKYICPKCGNSFRATKDIRVMCLDCFEDFVKVKR